MKKLLLGLTLAHLFWGSTYGNARDVNLEINVDTPASYELNLDGSNAKEVAQAAVNELVQKGVKKVWLVHTGGATPPGATDPLIIFLKQKGIQIVSSKVVDHTTYKEITSIIDESQKTEFQYAEKQLGPEFSSRLRATRTKTSNFWKRLLGLLHINKLHLILYDEPNTDAAAKKKSNKSEVWTLVALKYAVSAIALYYGAKTQNFHILLPLVTSFLWLFTFDTRPSEVIGATSQWKVVHYLSESEAAEGQAVVVKVNPLTAFLIQFLQSVMFRQLLTFSAHVNLEGFLSGHIRFDELIHYKDTNSFLDAHLWTLGTSFFGTFSKVVVNIALGNKRGVWPDWLIDRLQNLAGILLAAGQVIDQFNSWKWARSILASAGILGLFLQFRKDIPAIKSHYNRHFSKNPQATQILECKTALLHVEPL